MTEAETNLKRAAVEFIEAADAAGRAVVDEAAADPLDAVDTDLFELGEFEPVLGRSVLEDLRRHLGRERLVPEAVMELVALARQVAAVILDP